MQFSGRTEPDLQAGTVEIAPYVGTVQTPHGGTSALQRFPLTADHCCCMSYPQLVVDRRWTTTVEVAARLLSSTCSTDPEETSPDNDTGSTAVECRRRDS